jgi:hypothetical protein
MEAASHRVLVVANRTAATSLLIETVRNKAAERPCTFTLLIPNEPRKGGADWTLETALPLLERAAGAPVEGMVGEEDPFEAVSISTMPKRVSEWLRRDLPHRIERLGVPVTTVSQSEEREAPVAPAGVRM